MNKISRKYFSIIVLLALIILIAFATNNIAKKQRGNDLNNDNFEGGVNFVETNLALPEFSLNDLFSKNLQLTKNDFLGKYTIVNFFASWCTTCQAEHEILLHMQANGVADLYGIAWRDIDENTKKFLNQAGNPYSKIGVDNKAIFSQIANIDAVPETWLVDPKVVVVLRLKGNLQEFSIDEIKKYILLH
jgi:cytochrome c biogenesis protein CcmG/thiol:disulfide interchange protein DsbE